MKLAYLTASTAALLLSSTALMAQSEPAQNIENVYIDVGGTAVQVPIGQAAEACAMDEATLQQVAQTRLADSGLDPAVIYGLGNESADATGAAGSDTATTTADTASAEGLGEMGSTDPSAGAASGTDTASAEVGATSDGAVDSAGTAGGDTASADASATMDSSAGTGT